MTLRMGWNLGGGKNYWDAQVESDLIRQSGLPGGNAGKDLLPDGWPRKVDATTGTSIILMATSSQMPAGTYTVIASGTGRFRIGVQYGEWVTCNVNGPRQTFKAVARDIKPVGRNINLTIDTSSEADPVKVHHIYSPDAQPDHPFRPDYLKDLIGGEVVRTMDWQGTNNVANDIITWNDLKNITPYFTVFERVIPLDRLAEISNQTGQDLWACIPYRANDDCITSMARYLHDSLDPNRKIYIELSNELWNGAFRQVKDYLLPEAQAAKEDYRSYGAAISARKINVFANALSKTNRKVIRVIAGQVVQSGGVARILDKAAKANGGYDALACAPYFGIPQQDPESVALAEEYNKTTTTERRKVQIRNRIFNRLHTDIEKITSYVQEWRNAADEGGVPVYAYEMGQHCVAFPKGASTDPQSRTPLFSDVNKDPRMETAYVRYLEDLEAAGLTLAMHYQSHFPMTQYGFWGAKEWIGQPDSEAPKYRAIQKFIAKRTQQPKVAAAQMSMTAGETIVL